MQHIIRRRGKTSPFFSVVIVDSRSDQFAKWVEKAIFSIQNQTIEDLELIVIDNRKRLHSIGKCYNEGMRLSQGKWVYFLGDDDYLSFDYLASLKNFIENFVDTIENTDIVIASTFSTFFSDDGKETKNEDKSPMGAYRRSYFINKPFNETIDKYIDIEAMNRAFLDNKLAKVMQWHYGYFYRQHHNNISGRKVINKKKIEVMDTKGIERDFYIVDKIGNFSEEIGKYFKAVQTTEFSSELALKSKIIFCDWADKNAIDVSNWDGNQLKILRIHRYEAYNGNLSKINLDNFDYILVGAGHIAERLPELKKAKVVKISVGVDTEKFTLSKEKDLHKIGYAGYICRKKGSDLLMFLAEHFPEYEFHLKGDFQEKDFEEWFFENKPNNVFVEKWDDKVNEFFQDKGFVISPAISESFHRSLAEGMLTGCIPLIYNWIGADSIYPKENIFKSIFDLRQLLNRKSDPEYYRRFIVNNYNIGKTLHKIEYLIKEFENDNRRNVSNAKNIVGRNT